MKTEKNGSYRLALCALFAALSYAVFTFLQMPSSFSRPLRSAALWAASPERSG